MAIGRARHEDVVQRLSFLAGDGLDGGHALGGGYMGEGQLSGYVTDGVDAGNVGSHAVVNGDVAALGGDAHGFEAQVFGVGQNADGHQDLIVAGGFADAVLFNGEGDAVGVGLGVGYAGSGLQFDAVAVEGALQLLAYFLVFVGHQVGQQFDNGDVGAVHLVNVGEFHADGTAANDGYGVRNVVGDDAFPAGDDAFAIDREGRDAAGPGPGGDDDVAGVDAGGLTVGSGDVNGVGAGETAGASDVVNAVFAEKEVHATGHPVNDLTTALHGDGVIGAEVVEGQAKLIGPMQVGYDFCVFQQGLGRNATPVEAYPAESFSLDDAGSQTQLAGPDAGNIAAGSAANNRYVILRIGRHLSAQSAKFGLAQSTNPGTGPTHYGGACAVIVAL